MSILFVDAGGSESTREFNNSVRGHYALGAVGLGITAFSVFLAYSTILGVANLFPLLSTTVVTLVGIVTWVVVWLTLDVAYEWFLGRNAIE